MITVQIELEDSQIIAVMRDLIRTNLASQSRNLPLSGGRFEDLMRCVEVCQAANVIIEYCGSIPEPMR